MLWHAPSTVDSQTTCASRHLSRTCGVTGPDFIRLSKRQSTSLYPLNQLQAVMNAWARLIFNVDRRDHITPLIRQLYWLRVPDRIRLLLNSRHWCSSVSTGLLSQILAIIRRAMCGRCTQSKTPTLGSIILTSIPATRRSSIGDRVFVVMAASVWNKLPQNIRSAMSLPVLWLRLSFGVFANLRRGFEPFEPSWYVSHRLSY